MKARLIALAISGGLLLAGCSGVSFVKEGESEAESACEELASVTGEDVSIAEGLAGFMMAETYASNASQANDDYDELYRAIKALNESLLVGSEDLAQSAWERAARACNSL